MLKKIGFAALLVVGGLFALNTFMPGLANVVKHKARKTVERSVPLEVEIQRIRSEIAQINPDVKRNIGKLAEEMVAVERLKKDVVASRERLEKQRETIRAMAEDLKRGDQRIVYDGVAYSSKRVEEKLRGDLGSAKRAEDAIKAKEQLLEQKERGLDAARERLESMKSQKEELEVQLAQLEADLNTVRLTHTRSQTCVDMDDSRLAEIKKSLAGLRNRLEVEKKKSDLQAEFGNDPIPVEKKNVKTRDHVLQEAEAYLTGEEKRLADKK